MSETRTAGRPGHRTMKINGRSAVSYLVRTPRVAFFLLILKGLEANGAFSFPGVTWDCFRCTVEPFAGHLWARFIGIMAEKVLRRVLSERFPKRARG